MSLTLSLETSTDVCSVALHRSGSLVKELVINEPQAHASKLAPLINDLFEITSLKKSELQAVIVTSGPGSYTGLRIGASTAKGICFALDVPLIAIPTLTLLAYQGQELTADADTLFCPMIDARRMEVYCEVYNKKLNSICPVEAKIIDEHSFAELLVSNKMLFLGNGAAKCKPVLKNSNALFADGVVPLASFAGKIGYNKLQRQEFENLESFKPFYLKEFVAKKASPLLS